MNSAQFCEISNALRHTYIIPVYLSQDVAYKPQEFYVKTRKCERDAGANVVQMCERQVYSFMSLPLQ